MSFLKHNSYKEVPKDCDYITFGMGCFWGAEKRFWEVKGLETTVVGYSGGKVNNPTYEEVWRAGWQTDYERVWSEHLQVYRYHSVRSAQPSLPSTQPDGSSPNRLQSGLLSPARHDQRH